MSTMQLAIAAFGILAFAGLIIYWTRPDGYLCMHCGRAFDWGDKPIDGDTAQALVASLCPHCANRASNDLPESK